MVWYPGVCVEAYIPYYTCYRTYSMGSSYIIPPANNNECKLPLIHSLDLHGYQNTLPPFYRPTEISGLNPLTKHVPYFTSIPTQMPPVGLLPGFAPQSYGSRANYTPSDNVGSYSTTKNTSITQNKFAQISPVSSPSRSDSSSVDGLSTLNNVATASEETFVHDRKLSESSDSHSDTSDLRSDSKSTTPVTAVVYNEQSASTAKNTRPRKKRQCPECNLYFSNLATHKSTHLKPTSRPHICKYCNRGFARPNDLFRHTRCHWKEVGSNKGQFKCPYKNHSTGDNCCHSSGIFSRCDTFKNHLKAIHFLYPSGTKKDQRNKVSGNCRMCHKFFTTVDDWLVNHVEKNECPFGN